LAVSVTAYDPADEYMCVTVEPVPVEPSPNDQLNKYGVVPPLADAVKVTCCPTWGEDGLKLKLAVSVGGGLETVMDCWDDAVC
jgi:hypothetical protein